MMRRIRRILAAALCMTAVLALCVTPALSAEGAAIYIEGSAANESVFQVYFRSTAAEPPTAESLSVSVNGQAVPVQSVQTYDYVDAGTSYFILADSSTSVIERALRDIRELTGAIASGMSRLDNIYIGQLGESIEPNGFLDDSEKIAARIQTLSKDEGGNDLYQSVADALDALTSSPLVKGRKCLVIIADGMDNNAAGLSEAELSEKIAEAGIPICTVALTYGTENAARIAAAKALSSLARQSGGTPILLGENGMGTQQAAEAVLQLRAEAYAAVLNAADVRAAAEGAEASFSLTLTAEEGECSAERSLDISALPAVESALPVESAEPGEAETAQEPSAAPEETEAAAATPAAGGEPQEQADVRHAWLLWALIAAGAVAAAAAILLIVLLGRKRRGRDRGGRSELVGAAVRYDDDAKTETQPQTVLNGPQLVIVRIGAQEGVRFQLHMTQPLVIGRDPKQAQLIIDEDAALSGAQCRLDWRDDSLIVSELSSAGTTRLNGAPVGGGKRVQTGDVLHIGACDYRIFWEKA